MRLALIVEYDGTCYAGFQYQKNARSIQEEIKEAITRFTGERVRVRAAGRTDAGVHARGQVVAFDTVADHPMQTVIRALNHYLPEDIAVRSARQVREDFDPRRDAISRRYRYTVMNSTTRSPLHRQMSYQVSTTLDLDSMAKAARLFRGVHDFARFAGRPSREGPVLSTVREVFSLSVEKTGESVTIEVVGNAFLTHQVRRMAGALVDLGRGALTSRDLEDMLTGRPTEAVARTLPARGLCLMGVQFKESLFDSGEEDGRSI